MKKTKTFTLIFILTVFIILFALSAVLFDYQVTTASSIDSFYYLNGDYVRKDSNDTDFPTFDNVNGIFGNYDDGYYRGADGNGNNSFFDCMRVRISSSSTTKNDNYLDTSIPYNNSNIKISGEIVCNHNQYIAQAQLFRNSERLAYATKSYDVSYNHKGAGSVPLFDSKYLSDGQYTLVVKYAVNKGATGWWWGKYWTTYTFVSDSFTIDTTAPTGTLSGVTNGGRTNKNASLAWSDDTANATLDGNAYSSGATISAEGAHTIVLTDRAGNSSSYSFTIDKTAPTGTLSGVADGGFTKHNVSFEWGESSCSATLNGAKYTSGSTISDEGHHTIVLTDQTNNSTSYSFTIDKTAPTGTLSGVVDGGYTNKKVSLTWDNGQIYTVTLNGNYYSKGDIVSLESNYTFVLTDQAGNSKSYSFTIDKTAPTGTFTDINITQAKPISNKTITFAWRESYCSATLDGIAYSSGSFVSAEGEHTIVLTDRASNFTSYSFTIDKTAPTGTLSGVVDGGYTNKNVSFAWSDTSAKATLEGVTYISGATVSAEGVYTIVLTDRAGNTTSYSFNIDKTAPTGTFTDIDITQDKPISNKSVTFAWRESYCSATLDGAPYDSGAIVSAEGAHTVALTDRAGNTTSYSFEIDKTVPTGTLSGVADGGYTNKNVSFAWSDTSAKATLNNTNYINGAIVSAEGNCTIVLTDRAGNTTSYSFNIDKTAPTGTFTDIDITQDAPISNKSVTFAWRESYCSATLDSAPYESSAIVSAEGAHIIVLTDRAGNSKSYNFEIDKTAPTGTLSGVVDGGNTNKNVSFEWTEQQCTATLNGAMLSYTTNNNTFSALIINTTTTKIDYKLVLTDRAGNSKSYTFTIDKTLPTGTFYSVNGNILSNNSTFAGTFNFRTALSNSVTINGAPYFSETNIIAPVDVVTKYNFIVTNSLGTTNNFSITIDKIKPTIAFFKKEDNQALTILPNTECWFNFDIVLNYDLAYTLKINNIVTLDNLITTTPNQSISYNIIITDILGNENTYLIILDTQKYTANYDFLYANYIHNINLWYETFEYSLAQDSVDSSNKPTFKYIQSTSYSFSSLADINSYAFDRENSIAETYDYTGGSTTFYSAKLNKYTDSVVGTPKVGIVHIYKDINNATKLVAYFNETSFRKALEHYAQASISKKTIPSVPAIEFQGNDSLNIPKQKVNTQNIFIKTSSTLPFSNNNNTLIVNNKVVDYSYVLAEGINNISEVTKAGNITKYIVCVDTFAPNLRACDFAGNELSFLTADFNSKGTVYFNEAFRLFVNDNIDTNCIMKINEKTIIFSGSVDNFFDFKESGEYSISLVDTAGNKKTIVFFLSLTTPSVTIEETKDSMDALIGFNVLINKVLSFNQIQQISIYRFNIDLKQYTQITQDDLGATIVNTTLSYSFQINAKYKIIVLDRFAQEVMLEYSFAKNAPTGSLFTKENGALSNNAYVNNAVYFTWKDTFSTAFINGAEYVKNSLIFNEGIYNIELKDKSGNITIYSFTIDKTAPVYKISGVTNGGTTSSDVSVDWSADTENGTLAFIASSRDTTFNAYTKGAPICDELDYSIKLVDRAGNTTHLSFTIDKTAPTIVITNIYGEIITENITNKKIQISWDGAATCFVNNSVYKKDTIISTDGIYVITVEDSYGNSSATRIKIDMLLNDGTLSGVTNGGYTNKNVTFTWDDTDALAELNGISYNKNSTISAEGEHTIVLTDRAGNSKSYTFTIDTTAPTGTFTDIDIAQDAPISNKSVTFAWRESYCLATLDGAPYESGAIVSAEGEHTIVLTDRAGNSTSYSFEIDKTAPTGTLSGVIDGGYTNNNVIFSWNDNSYTATLNGENYIKDNIISTAPNTNQLYTIVLTDRAGNSISYSFTIDRTAPTGQIFDLQNNELENFCVTNKTLVFEWRESYCSATLDGAPYESGASIKNDGKYKIILSDRAGNTTSYSFTISKELPIFTIVNNVGNVILEKEFFAFSISFDFLDNLTATLNGNSYSSNTLVSAENSYTFVITNKAGNSKSFKFTIDKTAPTGTLSGVADGEFAKNNVAFEWRESYCSATLDGNAYSSGATISAEGEHIIVLTDRASNFTSYSFTIDKTAPTGTLSGVVDGGYTNKNVSFAWSDTSAKATLDGVTYTSGAIVSAEGEHTIVLTDRAGNTTLFKFTIDKTAPTGTLSGVADGGFTKNSVTFAWRESYCSATLDGAPYESGTFISAEGLHELMLSDRAGNTTSYSFTLYKKDLYYTIIGVNADNYSNSEFSIIFDELHAVKINDVDYASGTVLTQEGVYSARITNKAGVSELISITIDKTAPTIVIQNINFELLENLFVNESFYIIKTSKDIKNITINNTLYSDTLVSNNGTYSVVVTDFADNSFSFSISLKKATPSGYFTNNFINNVTNSDVCFIFDKNLYSATLNGKPYLSETIVGARGKIENFIILLGDKYGNQSIYEFSINKTLPDALLFDKNGNLLQNGATINIPAKVTFEKVYTAKLNDVEYLSDTFLIGVPNKETTYNIFVYDKYGNFEIFSVIVNLIVPAVNEDYETTFCTNKDISFSWDDDTNTALLNNIPYEKGCTIVDDGIYEFVLVNTIGNKTIYSFEIDKTAPIFTVEFIRENDFVTSSTTITWSDRSLIITLDGAPYESGSTISLEKTYTVFAKDRAGNTTTKIFTIYKKEPSVEILYKENTTELTNDSTFYASIKLSSNDTIFVNDIVAPTGFEISAIGEYNIKIVNIAGVSVSYKISIHEARDESGAKKMNASIINTSCISLAVIILVILVVGVLKTVKNNKKKIL